MCWNFHSTLTNPSEAARLARLAGLVKAYGLLSQAR